MTRAPWRSVTLAFGHRRQVSQYALTNGDLEVIDSGDMALD
jgi:hypothetical protein